jgi:hypothetical protein
MDKAEEKLYVTQLKDEYNNSHCLFVDFKAAYDSVNRSWL